MIYSFPFEIPANTSKENELIREVNLKRGKISRIDITFPYGCSGLVYFAIDKGNHQILPENTGEYFCSDNEVITSNLAIPILERPYILKLRGYNLDDTYKHKLQVRFYILSEVSPATLTYPDIESEVMLEELGFAYPEFELIGEV